MSTSTIDCTGYVNGAGTGYDCRVTITQNVHVETVAGPEFDERWSFTDTAGHFHAYDQTKDRSQTFPTLRERLEKIPCGYTDHDDDCDGEDITHYHCRICAEEVKPGMVPGPHTVTFLGLSDWRAELSISAGRDAWSVPATWGDQVSLRAEAGDVELFGIAIASVDFSSYHPDGSAMMTAELLGNGPLGRRTVRRAKAVVETDVPAWLGHLPADEVRQFSADLVEAVEQGRWRALEQTVREWKATALIHADPMLAERLRGPIGDAS